MSEFQQRNFQVLQERWPQVAVRLLAEDWEALKVELVQGHGSTLSVCGIQLTSRHDRTSEAQMQAASLPNGSPRMHVYGTGLGDLQQVLLAAGHLRELQVHILNGALFALVLQLLDQTTWLTDPRVTLTYAGDGGEIQLPFFALPAELVLADDFNAKIRDRLVSENHLVFNNRRFDERDPQIAMRLQASLEWLRSDADVAELFGTQSGREFYVIATGPSLEHHFQRLRTIREQPHRPLFICVDTAYRLLLAQGISPDIVVSIDQAIGLRHLPGEESAQTALVYQPLTDPAVLKAWRGRRYGGYSPSPLFDRLRLQVGRGELHGGGSVIHPAVDLAVKMGAAQITLLGADFAFPMDKTHAGWGDGELGPTLQVSRYWVLDGHGQRVRTQLNFRGYLCELERYIARHPSVGFFNSSRLGARIAGADFNQEFTS